MAANAFFEKVVVLTGEEIARASSSRSLHFPFGTVEVPRRLDLLVKHFEGTL